MSKVRVYEVAKQLNMDQKTLVALFQSMGLGDVRNHMSAVESDAVERLKRHIERQKTPEVVEEKIRPTVIKRKARAAEPSIPEAPPSVPQAAPSVPRAAPSIPQAAPSVPEAPRSSPRAAASLDGPAAPAEAVPAAPASAPAVPAPPASQPGSATPPVRRRVPAARKSEAHVEAAPSLAEPPVEAPSAPAVPEVEPLAAQAAIVAPVVGDAEAASPPAAEPTPVAPAPKPSEPAVAPAVPPAAPSQPRVAMPPPRPSQGVAAEAVLAMPEPARPSAPPEAPRRPSSPPKTGIDVWQGRPGVPMPVPRTGPPARRTTYDPRAAATPGRPGAGYGPGGRPMMGGGRGPQGRPGFRPRPGMPMPKRGPVNVSTQEMASHKKVIKIEEQVSLQQLAAKMSLKSTDVLMRLLSMGMTGVNINTTLDADTAKILAGEFGWAVEDVAISEADTLSAAMEAEATTDDDFEIRPPIVTVMGHVDHGKTSLLDRIRKATVAEGEAGGITQHVGAYRVDTARGTVAFLDTPGHEAFTAMRARGASLTDIVILVVAADDGVMPQTREAIAHAKSAKVPMIVAVNKIDKPTADPDKIKRDLASIGLQPEEWGGDTMFVHVSAKTGEGIDKLLESVLLQAEVLELKAYPQRRANGVVIEALLDRGRGPVARVMIQDGTLHTGDFILAGGVWGKVRAMTDELGRSVAHAGPATPVEILGLGEVPSAGDPVHAVKDAKTAEEIAETRRKKASKSLIPQDSRVSLEALTTRLSEADQLELKLIIKGDVQGSVEAIGQALSKLTTPKVKVTLVAGAVGGITEGDVNLAVAAKAIIVGFNVRPAGKAAALAESEGIEIRLYNIIYNAVDDIRSAMEGLLPATRVEKFLGRAEIRQVFKLSKQGPVAGCMVTTGSVKRNCEARLLRAGAVVWTGRVAGLRRFKDDVKEVAEGMECGISLDGYTDYKESDIIEAFEIEEIKTKL
jgi:translation initiation factor IF-2